MHRELFYYRRVSLKSAIIKLMVNATLWAILPFAAASAVSPVVLSASIFSISSRKSPLQKSLAYLLGSAFSIAIIGVLIIFFDHTVKTQTASPNTATQIIHLIVGLLLVGLAWRSFFARQKKAQRQKNTSVLEFFVLGVVLMASNYSSIIMYFPAADILNTSAQSVNVKAVALALMMTFTLILAIIAPLALIILGKNAQKITLPLSRFVERYSRYIIALLFGAIGILLIASAARSLW